MGKASCNYFFFEASRVINQGEAKKDFNMLHLVSSAASLLYLSVGLLSVQSQAGGGGKIGSWRTGVSTIVRDMCI